MEKKCFKCHRLLPIAEFYKHSEMADGYLNKCKDCAKKDNRENRLLKLNFYRKYDNKRSKTSERKLRAKIHTAEWRQRYPDRYKAHCTLNNAVRDRKIIKPKNCEICGKNSTLHGHHEDYRNPLIVVWLCEACHAQIQ